MRVSPSLVFDKTVKGIIWALLLSTLSILQVFSSAPRAYAVDTTIKIRFIESGTALVGQAVNYYKSSVGSSTLTTDANGEVTLSVGEGYNDFSTNVTYSDDLSMSFGGYIYRKGDSYLRIYDYFGGTPAQVDGAYVIEVQRPNVSGKITRGGSSISGYISGVWDVTAEKWINVPRWGVTSNSNFYVRLPVGKFLIGVVPFYRQGSYSFACNVTDASSQTTCNIDIPAYNLQFNIIGGDNQILSQDIYANLYKNDKVAPRGSWIGYEDGGLFSSTLSDGDYSLDIYSNYPDRDGMTSRFTFSVSSGVLSKMTNSNGETVTATSGVFPLKLTLPNFFGLVKANGENASSGWAYAYQKNFWQYSSISSTGQIKFALPNGKNTIQINPSGSETPTVVSSTFDVVVKDGAVETVTDSSGNLISQQDSKYPLNFRSPNLVGKLSVNGVGLSGWFSGLWNTVNNNWAKYESSGIDSNGNYSILVPAGNYDILAVPQNRPGGVKNCNVTSGVTTTCNLAFPADNFKFDVLGSDSAVVTSDLNVRITPLTITRDDFRTYTLPFYTEYGVSADNAGRHSISLLDGTYRLNLSTSNPNKYGTDRELRITVETGTVTSVVDSTTKAAYTASDSTYALPLQKANFKGILKSNGAISASSWVYGYPTSGDWRWYTTNTNSSGQFAFTLPDGEFYFSFNPLGTEEPPVVRSTFLIKVESSTVSSVINSYTQTNVSSSANGFELELSTANLKGLFTIQGESAFDNYFYVNALIDTTSKRNASFQYNNYGGNKYALLAPEGTYQTIFNRNGSGFLVKDCVISNSALNTCNAEFPNPNVRFKIQSFSGEDLLSDVSATSFVTLEDKSGGWGAWMNMGVGGVFNGTFSGPSSLGYSISIGSNVSPGTRGTPNTYEVTLGSDGVVTSVTDRKTGVAAEKVNGIYLLKLASPSLAGTVVGPDGTTPIPNASVYASGPEWTGVGTDRSGNYAFRLLDGTYTVWATPPWSDSTKVESTKQKVVVTNGVGNNNLQLQLRNPNVTGTVSGPKGNSPYNYIRAMKQNDYGYWEYIGIDRHADSSGKFVFYLEAGTYRFAANADEENAGGGSVVSDTCEVTNVSETKTCNIVLSSYNLKMKLKGSAGAAYTQASAYFYFEGNKEDATSRPLKTWDSSGTNKLGEMRFALTQGTWRGYINVWGQGNEGPLELSATVDSAGQVTTLQSGSGTTFNKDSSGIYEVQLPTSNLTGTITFENKRVEHGSHVQVMREVDGYYEYVYSAWSSAGKYALIANPGTYEIWVMPYPNTPYSVGTPVHTKVTCVVPETGSVNCDVALRTGNFHGKIVRPSGEVDPNSYMYLYQVVESNEKGTYEKWTNQTSVYGGYFSTYLENGTYNLWVGPNWNSSGKYTSKLYRVVVSGGAITSAIDLSTTNSLTATGGIYSFALGSPSVTGKVLKPTGSDAVSNILVLPIDSNGNELWQYSTYTNGLGEFALNIPNGTYSLSARTWGDGYQYTNSALTSVTVSGGAATNIEIRLRSPNLTGRVVSPSNSSVGLSYVWVYGFVDGQYFWGNTNSEGYFGAYIENSSSANCPSNCRVTLHFWNNPNYASKSYTINSVGNLGNLTPGVVNAKVQVKIPVDGSSDVVSKWSWVSVQELSDTGTVLSEFGASTNELGIAGLSLTVGKKYKLFAYPSWEYYSRYSYKTVEIASFNATSNALTTITFDSPNVTLVVKDRRGNGNSWGWYEVYQGTGGSKTLYLDSYLNDQGRGALTLPDGTYTLIIYPGKGSGVPLETSFTVSSGTPSGTGFGATGVGQFTLAGGNVSGKIFAADSSTVLASIPITAVRDDDNSISVTTVSQSDGYYELNLNRTFSWTIRAINPTSMYKGSTTLAAGSASNEVASNKHVYLNTSVP